MSVKPIFSTDNVHECARYVYGLDVLDLKEYDSFEDKNYRLTCAASSSNRARSIEMYVMKISKVSSTIDSEKLKMQIIVTDYLATQGFICCQCIQTVNGESVYEFQHNTGSTSKMQIYLIRVLTYIPGDQLFDHMTTISDKSLLTEIGEFTAKLHISLESLSQSKQLEMEVDENNCWRMDNLSKSRDFLIDIQDEKKRGILSKVLDQFESDVMVNYEKFSKGIIHGDITDSNLIVNFKDGKLLPLKVGLDHTEQLTVDGANRDQSSRHNTESKHLPNVSTTTHSFDDKEIPMKESDKVLMKYGIIDFTDMTKSCYVFEVAMVIKDMIVDTKTIDPLRVAAYVLGGYLMHRTLSQFEVDAIFPCILAGLYQYVVLGHMEHKRQPENVHASLGSEEGWYNIQKLFGHVSKCQALDTWTDVLQCEYGINIW